MKNGYGKTIESITELLIGKKSAPTKKQLKPNPKERLQRKREMK